MPETNQQPAGWPSDEAIAQLLYVGVWKDIFHFEHDLVPWDKQDSDDVQRGYLTLAVAVQRLYAPLRERLAELEAASEETADEIAEVDANYAGLRERLARLEALAQQMVDGDTIGPVEYHAKYPDAAANATKSEWLSYYVAKARAALEGGNHDAA